MSRRQTMGVGRAEMDIPADFAYAPPSAKLEKRLEQMAELGGFDSSPLCIMQMTSYVLLLGTSSSPVGLEPCEDGGAVRVAHRVQQGSDESPGAAGRSLEEKDVCLVSRAIVGGTPGAASCVAEAPLRTWLTDGCHTSLVCFSLPSDAAGTATSPPTTDSPSPYSSLRLSADLAASAPALASVGALPATLELLLGLEHPSVLLECLHAAFSGPAGPAGLALWCFELRGADGTGDLSSSLSSSRGIGLSGSGVGGARSRHRSPGASRGGAAAAATAIGGAGGGGSWRDLMGEAVAETLAQGSPGRPAAAELGSGARAGGGNRASASAGGGPSQRHPSPTTRFATRGSVSTATASLLAAEGPVHAASVAEAIAALHAAFARSSLWRRRDPASNAVPSSATAAAPTGGRNSGSGGGGGFPSDSQAPLLEAVTPPDGPAAVQLFVRLGVRLQGPMEAPAVTQIVRGSRPAERPGTAAAAAMAVAARGQRGAALDSGSWTTLDLVFIGCDPTPAEGRWDSDGDSDTQARGRRGPGALEHGGGWALGPVRELLEELVSRQSVDTGIPRPLQSTTRTHGTVLARRLAPLLAGNVAPHLLLGLPANLPGADTPSEVAAVRSGVLGALQLLSEARAIRTVVTRSAPPPPLYGAAPVAAITAGGSASGGGGGSSSRAVSSSPPEPLRTSRTAEEDRRVAALLRMRHSQELKDVVAAYRKSAEAAAADGDGYVAAGETAAQRPEVHRDLDGPARALMAIAAAAALSVERARLSGGNGGGGSYRGSAAVTGPGASALAGPLRSSEGSVLLERWEQRQSAAAAAAAVAGTATTPAERSPRANRPLSGAARPLDGPPWGSMPELPSSPAVAHTGVGRARRSATVVADDDGDFSYDYVRRQSAPAADGTCPGSRSPRQQAPVRTPSRQRSGPSAVRASGGDAGSSSSSSLLGAVVVGGVPATGGILAPGSGGGVPELEPGGATLLVGGMAKLQRRLEALQRARRLREVQADLEGAGPGAQRQVAGADRYASALGPGSSQRDAAASYDSDSSRSADASTARGSGSSGCLYGSAMSGGSGGAAAAFPAHGWQSHPAVQALVRRSAQEEALAAMASPTAQAVIEQLLLTRQSADQPQPQPQRAQPLRVNHSEQLQVQHRKAQQVQAAQLLLMQRQLSSRSPATAASGPLGEAGDSEPKSAGAAAAAAAERLTRLRSEFERLYQSLVSEVMQESEATGAAARVPAPSARHVQGTSLSLQQDQHPHSVPHISAADRGGSTGRFDQASAAGRAGVTSAALIATSSRAGGSPSPHDGGGGETGTRRGTFAPEAASARPTSPNFRRSSKVAWAALPHEGPASGLYGALLAGYAVQGLAPPTGSTSVAAGGLAESNAERGQRAAGGYYGFAAGEYGISDTQYGIDLDAEDDDLLGGAGDGGEGNTNKIAAGGYSAPEPSVADWRPGDAAAVHLRSNLTATEAAPAAAAAAARVVGSGGSPSQNPVVIATPRGLERLLDSSSSSGEELPPVAVPAVPAELSKALPGSFTAAANRGSAAGFGEAPWKQLPSADGVAQGGGGTGGGGTGGSGGGDGGDSWTWPSAGGGEFAAPSGGQALLNAGHGGAGGRVRTGSGSGSVNDDASLGSWNDFIARDAAAVAAALTSPLAQPGPPPSPPPPPPQQQPTDMSPLAERSESLGLPSSKSSAGSPRAPAGSNGAFAAGPVAGLEAPADAAGGLQHQRRCSGGSVAAAASFLSGGSSSYSPSANPGHVTTSQGTPTGGLGAGVAAAADTATTSTRSVALRQRNQALLGVLERAAAGSEALQDKLYDMQLEVMELRAAMEVQQASHQAEVVRLWRHLRRAASAAAASEDEAAENAAAPTAGPASRERSSMAASAALDALVAAYEEDIEGLQCQVEDLVAGQRDLAVRCAEQELAALALDAVRSRRRSQHEERRAALVTAATGGGGGGAKKAAASPYPPAAPAAAAWAAPADPTTPHIRLSSSPSPQDPGRGPRGRSVSNSPHQQSLLQPQGRHMQQEQQQRPQRSRSAGRVGPSDARRRRHSFGPLTGVLDSAGPAPAGRKGRLGASADSTTYHRNLRDGGGSRQQSVSLGGIGIGSDGEGLGMGSGGTDVSEDEAGWWSPAGHRGLATAGGLGALGTIGGVSVEEAAWRRGRREMGALRSALRQAHRREAQLRAALAAAQQQRRAALLEARLAAAEGVRRRWLETQAADLAGQVAAARAAAAAAAAARDAAQREAARLHTEAQVMADQLEDMRRLTESVAQMASRSQEVELTAAAEWLRAPAA